MPEHQRIRSGALGTVQVEPVEVHHFRPSLNEVFDEFFFRIVTGVDFGDSPQLRVGTEDQIDTGTGPLGLAGFRLEDANRLHIRLVLYCIGQTRRERDRYIVPGAFRRLFHSGTATEDN